MMKWRAISLNGLGRGLAISLALHALVAVALLVSLPAPKVEPLLPEPAIDVSLVAPPETLEESEREPVQEPEPEPAEPAEPAEPDQPEQADAPEPPPAPPVPAPLEGGQAVPIPVLRPVIQFGERDAGPRVALDGDGVADAGEPEEAALASDAVAPPPTAARQADPDAPSEGKGASVDEPAGIALPEIALPEAALTETALDAAEPDASPSANNAGDAALLSPDPAPAEDQPPDASPPAAALVGELAEAERLYSPVLTEDRAAMVAMGDLPRAIRASQLCTTELREQLRRGEHPYQPELLPSYGLESGNVLAVSDAAFRADGVWYDLSFRCTVDDDAFKVSTFAFAVGEAIPRTEWQARGFPDF